MMRFPAFQAGVISEDGSRSSRQMRCRNGDGVGSMDFHASHMYARISPRKARLVVDLVRGMQVNQALDTLKFVNKRAKPMVEKVIRSALANAEQDVNVSLDDLFVSRAVVDEGPLLGGRARWRPISRGRAVSILKRTSHIKISLSEPAAEEVPAATDEKES